MNDNVHPTINDLLKSILSLIDDKANTQNTTTTKKTNKKAGDKNDRLIIPN